MAFANRYTGKALRPACQSTADLPAQAAIGNVAISPTWWSSGRRREKSVGGPALGLRACGW